MLTFRATERPSSLAMPVSSGLLVIGSPSPGIELVLFELAVELCLLEDLVLLALDLVAGLVPVLQHVLVQGGVVTGSLVAATSASSAGAATAIAAVAETLTTGLVVVAIVSASEVGTSTSFEATLLAITASH